MVIIGKDANIKVGDVAREIPVFSIKYKDVFHLRNLYVMMHEMMLEEGWHGFENDESHSEIESLYSENVYQKGIHQGGKELWVWWRAQKQFERGSSYFLNTLDMDWHVAYLNDIEIVHQGKKMKVNHGEVEIFFKARIISDIGFNWERNKFMKHFKRFYEDRILHAYLEKREKELWRDVYRLQSRIKAYLNLRTWMPNAELFHPKQYGWEAPEQI